MKIVTFLSVFAAFALPLMLNANAKAQGGSGRVPYPAERVKRLEQSWPFDFKGEALLGAGKAQDALEIFDKARAIYPESPNYYGLARAYTLLGRNDEARAMYRKFIVVEPSASEYTVHGPPATTAAMRYAILLSKMGRQDEALAMYYFGLRYLNRGNYSFVEPVPLTLVFGDGPNAMPYTSFQFQAAAWLAMAIDSNGGSGPEKLDYVDQAIALMPLWNLPHFYRGLFLITEDNGKQTEAARFAELRGEFKKALQYGSTPVLKAAVQACLDGRERPVVNPHTLRMQIPELEEARKKVVPMEKALRAAEAPATTVP